MSDRELKAIISATDKASPVFKQVADGAQKMGTSVEQAGTKGAKGLKAQEDAIKQVKIGAGALGVAFTLAARASLDQTRQMDALNRLYGDSADEVIKLTEAIQDNTNFSNDQARQAAITGSTLAQNYQLSAEQIGVLIERSADLAQVHGIDLADAMTRVSGAIRGEGEAAELLGLNMSDSAVATAAAAAGITNWTTGATEAEKAAFRYSLVLEQTNATLGAAQDAHDTTAGTIRGLANEVQDAAQSFAAWTGPVGEGAAVLSDYALQAGIALGGVVKLGEGLKQMGVASKLASVALSPVGLVGIAAGATVGIIALADALSHSYSEAAQDARVATEELGTSIKELLAQGSQRGIIGLEWQAELEAALDGVLNVEKRLAEIDAERNRILSQPALDKADSDRIFAQIDALNAEEAQLRSLADTFGGTTQAADEFAQTQDALRAILANTGVGAEDALASALALNRMWNEGKISTQTYMEAIQQTADGLSVWDEIAIRAAQSTKQTGDAAAKAGVDFAALEKAIGDLSATQLSPDLLADIETIKELGGTDAKMALQSYFDQFKKTGDLDAFASRVDAIADRLLDQARAADAAAAANEREYLSTVKSTIAKGVELSARRKANDALFATVSALDPFEAGMAIAEERQTAFNTRIAAFHEPALQAVADFHAATASAKEFIATIPGIGSLAGQLRPVDIDVRGGDKVTGTAADLQKTQSILGSVLGTFQTLDNLGQSSEQAGSIAENLVGEPGELALIDRLLNQNRISQDEYNAAVQAGYQIQKEQGAIENDLNTIRAKQLPLLADADRQYGNLIDRISHMNAEQATATLGFMDTNESLQAQNLLALAASASMGELGANGEAAATQIIAGAVAADPVLEQMLTQIGLVSRDHEGNLVVNFDNADTLKSSTDNLTTAINNLTVALSLIPSYVHTEITANDQASIAAANARAALAGLDGMTAQVYINVTQTGTNPATYGLGQQARNGGVMSFANGGVVSLAEAGSEMLQYANGGMAMAWSRGLYAVPDHTLVHTAPATRDKLAGMGGQTFNITVQGDINGIGGVNETLAAIKIAAREHFAGFRG